MKLRKKPIGGVDGSFSRMNFVVQQNVPVVSH